MHTIRIFLVSIFITLLPIDVAVNAASFDCGKAVTQTEKAICADPTLSDLDLKLSGIYMYASQVSINSTGSNEFKASQVSWLQKRNLCQANTKCLVNAYETRITELAEYDLDNLFSLALSQKQLCKTKAEEGWDTGVTRQMLNATTAYNDCLEDIITNILLTTTSTNADNIKSDLSKLRAGSNGLIYTIYSNKKTCSPFCGTMYRLYPEDHYSTSMETILNLLIEENETFLINDEMNTQSYEIPSATDIITNLPVCLFRSSFGPKCPIDFESRRSFRVFSNADILKMDLNEDEAYIETGGWFYSVSNIEAVQNGFKFTFTDDAKHGTYLVAMDFFVARDVIEDAWKITGEKLQYISGADQSKVDKLVKFKEPIPLEGL